MNKGVFSNAVPLKDDHFNINTMYAVAVTTCQLSAENNGEKKKRKQANERTNGE